MHINSVKNYDNNASSDIALYVRVCVTIPFILDVRFVDVSAGVTQDFSTFLLRRLRFNRSPLVGHFFFVCVWKNPSSCDDTEIRTHVPTSEGFEVIN